MTEDPFTWGDEVEVESDEGPTSWRLAVVVGLPDDRHLKPAYLVEYGDGSDEAVVRNRLRRPPLA